jgi:hypothetical protein
MLHASLYHRILSVVVVCIVVPTTVLTSITPAVSHFCDRTVRVEETRPCGPYDPLRDALSPPNEFKLDKQVKKYF